MLTNVGFYKYHYNSIYIEGGWNPTDGSINVEPTSVAHVLSH